MALKNNRTASAIFAEKLHPKWGPARQLKRISLDAERTNRKRLGRLAEVVSQREVRQALEKAPHVPAARGASSVPAFSARIQVDILFSADIIVLNAMAVYSGYCLLAGVCPRRPWRQEMPARDRGSRRSIDLRQCGRIRWESGEMEFGLISVPVASFIFSFSGGMLARVSWYAGMGRRGEFMTGWRRTAVPPAARFRMKRGSC